MANVSTAVAVFFALSVTGGMAFAQSSCDSAITKAAGKKVACKDGVFSKAQANGVAPDAAKLAKCEVKFDKACQKAKAGDNCVVQEGACAGIEASADTCAASLMQSVSVITTTTTTTTAPICVPPGGNCHPMAGLFLTCCDPQASCFVVSPVEGVCVPSSCTQPSDCPDPTVCQDSTCCFPAGWPCDIALGRCCAGCNSTTGTCN